MLVLTRKPGQSIIIGDGIEVEILSVAGEKIRVGISAPRDVEIFRHEVYERIEQEREAAREAAAVAASAGAPEGADPADNGTLRSPSAARAEPPRLARG
jgi:carbon storage regulator